MRVSDAGLLKKRIMEHKYFCVPVTELIPWIGEAKKAAPTDILKRLDPLEWIKWFETWFGN